MVDIHEVRKMAQVKAPTDAAIGSMIRWAQSNHRRPETFYIGKDTGEIIGHSSDRMSKPSREMMYEIVLPPTADVITQGVRELIDRAVQEREHEQA